MSELNEKEYLLIQGIAQSPNVTQRDLSEQAGLSLGMTNLLLKKLVSKGYVTVQQLNWQKVQYILTVRGALEKAKKSYSYAAKSYQDFKRTTAVIRANVLEEYGRGLRSFTIVVPPEIEELVREVVGELSLPEASFSFEPDLDKALARSRTVFAAVPASGGQAADKKIIPILEEAR